MADVDCTVGEKLCARCEKAKSRTEFGKHANRKDGLQVYCRACMRALRAERQYDKLRWQQHRDTESARNTKYRDSNADRLRASYREHARRRRSEQPHLVNAYNKGRKAAQRMAVPLWADRGQIATIYRKARELSERFGVDLQVDHVVPIRGKTVCGLHTPDNLQLLASDLNYKKRHWQWPDMP